MRWRFFLVYYIIGFDSLELVAFGCRLDTSFMDHFREEIGIIRFGFVAGRRRHRVVLLVVGRSRGAERAHQLLVLRRDLSLYERVGGSSRCWRRSY